MIASWRGLLLTNLLLVVGQAYKRQTGWLLSVQMGYLTPLMGL